MGNWIMLEGDALSVLSRMRGRSFACVVTSPPYNLGVNQGKSGKNGRTAATRWAPQYADSLPTDEYVRYHRDVLTDMLRLVQDDGLIWYVHRRQSQSSPVAHPASLIDMVLDGFPVRSEIVWDKGKPGIGFAAAGRTGGAYYPTASYEIIYLLAKSKAALLSRDEAAQGNVWRIPIDKVKGHAAAFPAELAARCIRSTLAEGDVLDPFMGSGSTAVAATECGRGFVGVEINEAYAALARRRLETPAMNLL